jgi:hypothetical protein
MPTFNLLRETPDNSGTFTPTGETVEGSVHDAVERCVALAANGGRWGMHVYESLRHTDAMIADHAATQAATLPSMIPAAAAQPVVEARAHEPSA